MNSRCQSLLMDVWQHQSDGHDSRALCRKLESVVERSHEGVECTLLLLEAGRLRAWARAPTHADAKLPPEHDLTLAQAEAAYAPLNELGCARQPLPALARHV